MAIRKEQSTGVGIDERNAWVRCPGCTRILFSREATRNLSVCSECGYHFRIGAHRRIEITVDPDSFEELFLTRIKDSTLLASVFKVRISTYYLQSAYHPQPAPEIGLVWGLEYVT